MAGQATELLKGTLEGIVLALLSRAPAYGYEITARLRDEGFTDLAEVQPPDRIVIAPRVRGGDRVARPVAGVEERGRPLPAGATAGHRQEEHRVAAELRATAGRAVGDDVRPGEPADDRAHRATAQEPAGGREESRRPRRGSGFGGLAHLLLPMAGRSSMSSTRVALREHFCRLDADVQRGVHARSGVGRNWCKVSTINGAQTRHRRF